MRTALHRWLIGLMFCASFDAAVAGSAPPAELPRWLVYVQESAAAGCEVRVFDRMAAATRLLQSAADCPKQLLPLQGHAEVMIIRDHSATVISLDRAPVVRELPAWPDTPSRANYLRAEAVEAGYLADGTLGLALQSSALTDESDLSLYSYRAGTWQRVGAVTELGRFDLPQHAALHRRPTSASLWDEEFHVWHDRQADNAYRVSLESVSKSPVEAPWARVAAENGPPDLFEATYELMGQRTVVTYATQPCADAICTLTMGLALRTGGSRDRVLATDQCDAWLVGRYLLWEQFGKYHGFELVDLATGKAVLTRLQQAMWSY